MGKEKASSPYYIITAFSWRKVGGMSAVQRNVLLGRKFMSVFVLGFASTHLHPNFSLEIHMLKQLESSHMQPLSKRSSFLLVMLYMCCAVNCLSCFFYLLGIISSSSSHILFSYFFFLLLVKTTCFLQTVCFSYKVYTYYRHTWRKLAELMKTKRIRSFTKKNLAYFNTLINKHIYKACR